MPELPNARRSSDRRVTDVGWAGALVVFAVLLGAASAMAGSGVGLLLSIVAVFGAVIWLVYKALGGQEQPLSHGGRRYEPPETEREENRRDVA